MTRPRLMAVPDGYRVVETPFAVPESKPGRRHWTKWGAENEVKRMHQIRTFPGYRFKAIKHGFMCWRTEVFQNVLAPPDTSDEQAIENLRRQLQGKA